MTGRLSPQWLEWFDKRTRAKSEGRTRIVHLDNHKTHWNLDLIDRAAEYGIQIIPYPSRATHAMQGLDRIHFGIVKKIWPSHVQEFERRTGTRARKRYFLAILNDVWTEVFTEHNNIQAFRVTGISIPVDSSRITERMTAPSEQTSVTGSFPVPQPTPVRTVDGILKLLSDLRSVPEYPDTPTRGRLADDVRAAIELSPSSMTIDPALLPTPKRKQAIARHLQFSGVDPDRLPTRSSIDPHLPIPELMLGDVPNCSPLPPDQEDPSVLRSEFAACRKALENAQHTMRSLNAQLTLQNEFQLATQQRLYGKEQKKKESEVERYFRGEKEVVYTDKPFREAVAADKKAAEKRALARSQNIAIAATKGLRAKWEKEQVAKRRKARTEKLEAWRKHQKECQKSKQKPPPKPPRERREKTPERFTMAIERAKNLSGDRLGEVREAVAAAGQGRANRQKAALEAMGITVKDWDIEDNQAESSDEEMEVDDPPVESEDDL